MSQPSYPACPPVAGRSDARGKPPREDPGPPAQATGPAGPIITDQQAGDQPKAPREPTMADCGAGQPSAPKSGRLLPSRASCDFAASYDRVRG